MTSLNEIAGAGDWTPDPDTDGGFVAEVNRAELAAITARLQRAGYDVSDSRDEEGRCYVWAVPQ